MKRIIAALVAVAATSAVATPAVAQPPAHASNPFRFGVITDTQYADIDTPAQSTRYYRDSIAKLTDAGDFINGADVAFTVQLGDIIDKDMASFDTIVPLWERIEGPRYSALGNHDFPVADSKVIEDILDMPNNYYDFSHRDWRFVVLDTNDISLYANEEGSADHELAQEMLADLKATGAPNAQTWNGAAGPRQLAWLRGVLADAKAQGQKVMVFVHHPVFGTNAHNAWDSEAIREVLESAGNVVAVLNGHDHQGRHEVHNGIEYINLRGMVEQPYPANQFAVVTVQHNKVRIDGQGRQEDFVVSIPQGLR